MEKLYLRVRHGRAESSFLTQQLDGAPKTRLREELDSLQVRELS